MTTPAREPAAARDGMEAAPPGADQTRPEGLAISPAVGGLPAIYVPRSPAQAGTDAALWRAMVRTAGRVARRLRSHQPAPLPPARSQHTLPGDAVTDIPSDLRYSKDHLWARVDPDAILVRVGVTDFAQQSLGDVVDVTLPGLGETVKAGEPCGDIESTKSVNDLIAPVSGTVRTRNDELASSPELVNADPYGNGWMFEVETDPATHARQFAALMDANSYRQMAGA
jgi:glycine cleavage system H protein